MRRLSSERGTSAVEFAVVSLLLISLLYGIITFGFVFALDNNLAHAAAEGARASIQKSNTTSTNAQIIQFAKDTAKDRLTFQKAKDVSVIDATIAACTSDPAVDCITVTIDYDYAADPLVPPLFSVNNIFGTLSASSTVQLD